MTLSKTRTYALDEGEALLAVITFTKTRGYDFSVHAQWGSPPTWLMTIPNLQGAIDLMEKVKHDQYASTHNTPEFQQHLRQLLREQDDQHR